MYYTAVNCTINLAECRSGDCACLTLLHSAGPWNSPDNQNTYNKIRDELPFKIIQQMILKVFISTKITSHPKIMLNYILTFEEQITSKSSKTLNKNMTN